MGRPGLEHPPEPTRNTGGTENTGAKSGAFQPDSTPTPPPATHPATPPAAPLDPDLREVVDAWPTIPPAIRAGILAMIGASRPGDLRPL